MARMAAREIVETRKFQRVERKCPFCGELDALHLLENFGNYCGVAIIRAELVEAVTERSTLSLALGQLLTALALDEKVAEVTEMAQHALDGVMG